MSLFTAHQSFDNGVVIWSKFHCFASEIIAALGTYRVTDHINMIGGLRLLGTTTARTKIELISQEKYKYPRTEISHDLLNFHDLPYVEA